MMIDRPMLFASGEFESNFTQLKMVHYQCILTRLVLCPDDPPVPSIYEHLKLQDVGSRSVYSGLNPYVNTRGNADLSTGKYALERVLRRGLATKNDCLFVDVRMFACWFVLLFLPLPLLSAID